MSDEVLVNLDELNRFEQDLGHVGFKAIAKAGVALRKTAYDIEGTAKLLVPVDTGATKNSIPASRPDGQPLGSVATGDLDLVAEAYRLEEQAAALERLTRAAGTLTLTDTAKVIGVSPKRLLNWMVGNDWVFREGKERLAAHQRRLEAGTLRQRIIRLYRSDGTETMGISVLVTAKGLVALAKALADPNAGIGPWKDRPR